MRDAARPAGASAGATTAPAGHEHAVVIRVHSEDGLVPDAIARLVRETLTTSGHGELTPGVIDWPPPAYCGPYLLTQWTDETRHADPCDCDEDGESIGARCMDKSDWTYAVCTVEGEWTPLFQKLPSQPQRVELHRELEALCQRVVDAAKRCTERRAVLRLPCEPYVGRLRREALEEADDELHAAVNALWEAEAEAESE
jgi:hypothetical protein